MSQMRVMVEAKQCINLKLKEKKEVFSYINYYAEHQIVNEKPSQRDQMLNSQEKVRKMLDVQRYDTNTIQTSSGMHQIAIKFNFLSSFFYSLLTLFFLFKATPKKKKEKHSSRGKTSSA
ncbi:CLUMA_CG020765, isoform A [Clunio marinus]|uniref:CLUMA_CG020765, isoform A n=1 Tax=Clunio marinus TaxID=568069 RepID=A0A1J1J5Y0_9DIPT|nr:CLUMA_CG020765, isoform A [Clunio marinus]